MLFWVLLMSMPSLANELPNPRPLWDFNDPTTSEQRFVDAAAATTGDEALLYETQRARALTLQRRFDEAGAALDAVESQLSEGPSELRAWALIERGRLVRSSGDAPGSRVWFEQALAVSQAVGHEYLAVDAAHMIAIVAPGEEGLSWNLKAIEMAQASSDPEAQKWQGSLLNNTGWSLHDLERYREALVLFEQALAFHLERGNEKPTLIARWSVARCLRSLERYGEALAIQHELLHHYEQQGGSDGYVYEELGELLLSQGQPSEAAPRFARAHQALSQDDWMVANEADRLARLARLSNP
jgi:tetratricopeptide (TPR) repeat protein